MRAGWTGVALAATWMLTGCFSTNGGALAGDPADGDCTGPDDCAAPASGGGGTDEPATGGMGGSIGVAGSAGTAGGIEGSGGAAGVAGTTPTAGMPVAGIDGIAGMDPVAGMAGVDVGGMAGVAGEDIIGILPMAGGPPADPLAGCDAPGAYDPLSPDVGETCYELRIHGASSTADTTPFEVDPGEAYHQFYYDVPWPAGAVATRIGTDFDNIQVIHSWRLFSSNANVASGTVQRNVTGTTLGEQSTLLAAYHVGGCNLTFPEDVGLRLPEVGKLMIQLHVYNTTGGLQEDSTRVQVCTVPSSARANVAGLTFLGTENLNSVIGMPPGMNEFSSICPNNSGGPITLVVLRPHMHFIGIQMRSEIMRAAGGSEVVFDQPFQFDYQIHYVLDPRPVMQPGDDIETTCTFFNDTGQNVSFGQSTNQEMCYQFAYSYPAGALDNGAISLIGAGNTCW